MEEISILGIVIGRGQVQMETNKVKAVKEWKTPTKIKEAFWGLQISTDSLSRTSVIWQNLLMNSKARKIGNGEKNRKKHLKS